MSQNERYIAVRGGNWIDTKTGIETRFEAGDEYTGPNPEQNVADGVIVPAPAGSRQPGNNDEGTEA